MILYIPLILWSSILFADFLHKMSTVGRIHLRASRLVPTRRPEFL